MADKDILEIREGENKGLINYTSSVINPFLMFTSNGISTYDEAIKLFDIISRYGLDSLTMTSLFEYLTNMRDIGLITDQDIGFPWKVNIDTFKHLIDIIVRREGFGDILAGGWKELAKFKKGLADHMLTVKGLDVVFEPRFLKLGTMEFEQVVNPKGAHVASGGSPTYVGAGGGLEKMKSHFNRMGIPNSAFERILSPPKEEMGVNVGRLTRYSEDWYTVLTSLGLCARAQMNRFYSIELVNNFYGLVTGIEMSIDDMRIAAERVWNLQKLLNMKEGFTRKDDKFPSNWFKSLKFGENTLEFYDFYGNVKIDSNLANQLIDDYYDERGWEIDNGLPPKSKLQDLGLERFI
jgi:aldehyde:ferredoxin oxidoreductase